MHKLFLLKHYFKYIIMNKKLIQIYAEKNDFPMLFKLKSDYLSELCYSIFSSGYNTFFPKQTSRKIISDYKIKNVIGGYYGDPYNKFNLYLFQEKCTRNAQDCKDGLDKYRRCCYVYDNDNKIIKTKYSDYPW